MIVRLAKFYLVWIFALIAGIAPACFAADSGSASRSIARWIAYSLPASLTTPQDYISRFVLYVRWPDESAIKTWQVCVASASTTTDVRYANLTVRDRAFSVRHLGANDTLTDCQILDLSDIDDSGQIAHFLQLAQAQHGVLTVGHDRSFCSAGGQICLHLKEPSAGFEVNLSAIRISGLAINAQLLMLARQAAEGSTP